MFTAAVRRFEDGDREDYYQDELEKHIELYNYLSERFTNALDYGHTQKRRA